MYNEVETKSTLEFGVRAKMIKNKPKVNREQSIPELKAQVAKLEKKVSAQQKIIKDLENFITTNGLKLPKDVGMNLSKENEPIDQDAADQDDMEISARNARRGSVDVNAAEIAKNLSLMQEACDELTQKLEAETEEKEFMKSLMDDLLEQLAQKENEKKTLQDQLEIEP